MIYRDFPVFFLNQAAAAGPRGDLPTTPDGFFSGKRPQIWRSFSGSTPTVLINDSHGVPGGKLTPLVEHHYHHL